MTDHQPAGASHLAGVHLAPGCAGISTSGVEAVITRMRARLVGEVAWVALMSGAVMIQLGALVPALKRPDLIDFAAFVDNARWWMAGTPYPTSSRDPNAPHVILLFAPFVGLPLLASLTAWLALSYATAYVTWRRISRETGLILQNQARTATLALFAVAPATVDVVTNGNMIWPLWWAFTNGWVFARHGRSGAGGAVLGVLMSAKPFLGLWLPYYVFRRDWRGLSGALVGFTMSVTTGVAVTGSAAWISWLHMLQRVSWFDGRSNASILGLLARVWRPDPGFWAIGAGLVSIVTLRWLLRGPRNTDRDWALLLLAALLISPLGWRYYFFLSIGPLLAWVCVSSVTRAEALLLLACWVCPTLGATHSSVVLRATTGSLACWSLLTVWLLVGRMAPREPAAPATPTSGAAPSAPRRLG